MSDTESASAESEDGGADEQSDESGSAAFVESLQSGLGEGLLDSLGGDDDTDFESVGRELGEQVGRLLGEALGRQLDEQIRRMKEESSGADDGESAEEGSDSEDEESSGNSPDPTEMSDDELQSAAEEISGELEERST